MFSSQTLAAAVELQCWAVTGAYPDPAAAESASGLPLQPQAQEAST